MTRVVTAEIRSPQRTPAGNRTTARGRSPGSRVVAIVHLPEASPQWHIERSLAGYSCGGSRGIKPRSLSNPSNGTLRVSKPAQYTELNIDANRTLRSHVEPLASRYRFFELSALGSSGRVLGA